MVVVVQSVALTDLLIKKYDFIKFHQKCKIRLYVNNGSITFDVRVNFIKTRVFTSAPFLHHFEEE